MLKLNLEPFQPQLPADPITVPLDDLVRSSLGEQDLAVLP